MSGAVAVGVVVVGGGTMGADVAHVFARGGHAVHVVEPQADRRDALPALWQRAAAEDAEDGIVPRSADAPTPRALASLAEVDWAGIGIVVECIVEALEPKRQLFAELVARARPDALLTSNSSGIPISAIGEGLGTRERMLGLHFFMPAHRVPLVEVVLGASSDPARGEALCVVMRGCGSVPVLVRKDLPGFLANRLQHALAREAFALLDAGVASAADIDAAVRFGFGFRFLAAGPILQRDHAGLDVHAAAARTIYPSLCNDAQPAAVLQRQVDAGRVGMKAGAGFEEWPADRRAAERARYDRLLRAGLGLLREEPGR